MLRFCHSSVSENEIVGRIDGSVGEYGVIRFNRCIAAIKYIGNFFGGKDLK